MLAGLFHRSSQAAHVNYERSAVIIVSEILQLLSRVCIDKYFFEGPFNFMSWLVVCSWRRKMLCLLLLNMDSFKMLLRRRRPALISLHFSYTTVQKFSYLTLFRGCLSMCIFLFLHWGHLATHLATNTFGSAGNGENR